MPVNLSTFPSARNDMGEDLWAAHFKRLFRNGVHAATPDLAEFAASPGGGMYLNISSGAALLDGFGAVSPLQQTFPMAAAHASLNRLDTVVLRLTYESPVTVALDVKVGTAQSSPVAPGLTANGSITEMGLWNVSVPAQLAAIGTSHLIDVREWVMPWTNEPVGTIHMTLLAAAPTGYLLVRGGTFNSADYPALAKALGVTASTFTLPNLSRRVPRGAQAGDTIGGSNGADSTTLVGANIPLLSHSVTPHTHQGASGIQYIVGDVATSTIYTNSGSNVNHSPAWDLSATPETAETTVAIADHGSGSPSGISVTQAAIYVNFIIRAY